MQKIEKIRKNMQKINQSVKHKQTNLSIFCKSNNELNNVFYGIDYACNNIPVIWGVGAV